MTIEEEIKEVVEECLAEYLADKELVEELDTVEEDAEDGEDEQPAAA